MNNTQDQLIETAIRLLDDEDINNESAVGKYFGIISAVIVAPYLVAATICIPAVIVMKIKARIEGGKLKSVADISEETCRIVENTIKKIKFVEYKKEAIDIIKKYTPDITTLCKLFDQTIYNAVDFFSDRAEYSEDVFMKNYNKTIKKECNAYYTQFKSFESKLKQDISKLDTDGEWETDASLVKATLTDLFKGLQGTYIVDAFGEHWSIIDDITEGYHTSGHYKDDGRFINAKEKYPELLMLEKLSPYDVIKPVLKYIKIQTYGSKPKKEK